MVTGQVKFPSDRTYKNGTRRKVVMSTSHGDVICWGDAGDPTMGIQKGAHAQIEITGPDNRGNLTGKIVSIGSNGYTQPQAVNGAPGHNPENIPSTGYPQMGPPVAPPMTGQPVPVSVDARIAELTETYLKIWSELTTNDKFPFTAEDEIIQKSVATIFIQLYRV